MTGGLRDPSTGLYADMKKVGEGPDAKNVLILGGTGVGKMDAKQVLADIGQGAGGIPANYKQADQLASLLKSELEARCENGNHRSLPRRWAGQLHRAEERYPLHLLQRCRFGARHPQ